MDKKKTGNLIREARNRKNYTQGVLLVMGISLATMIVVRLLSKRKHKYKDERSMDRS